MLCNYATAGKLLGCSLPCPAAVFLCLCVCVCVCGAVVEFKALILIQKGSIVMIVLAQA